jgi:hypothetical protein
MLKNWLNRKEREMNRFWVVKGEYRDPEDPDARPLEVYMSLHNNDCHWYNSVSSGTKYATRAQAEEALDQGAEYGAPREIWEARVIEVNIHPTGQP